MISNMSSSKKFQVSMIKINDRWKGFMYALISGYCSTSPQDRFFVSYYEDNQLILISKAPLYSSMDTEAA
jgi:hypothetical protein